MILLRMLKIGISSEWILSDSGSLIPEENAPYVAPSRYHLTTLYLVSMLNGQPSSGGHTLC